MSSIIAAATPSVNGYDADFYFNMAAKQSVDALQVEGASIVDAAGDAETSSQPAQATVAADNPAKAGYIWTDYVREATRLGFTFRINDLDDSLEVNGKRITDVVEAELLSKLHANGFKGVDIARRAFMADASRNRYNPIIEHFKTLKWDGKDHIARFAAHLTDNHEPIVYQDGTQRTVIHAALLRWLIGAVAKVYEPETAQNFMLILDGLQGKGKSHLVKWLCPVNGLHYSGAIRPEDKDYLGILTTKFVWEVSELGATMRKADREALKYFITLAHATYRPSYGRYAITKPALASFIGTVNFEGGLLSDPTGHRRFFPVALTGIDWGYSKAIDVNQLWAQACALYRQGETWQLTTEEKAAHAAICEQYEVEDVLEGNIRELFTVDPHNSELFTHTTEIIDRLRTFAGFKGSDRAASMQISATLTKMGLHKLKRDNRWGYSGIKYIEK